MTASEAVVRTEITERSAARARELGVGNELVDDSEALPVALVLAEEIGENAPMALAAIEELVRSAAGAPGQAALAEAFTTTPPRARSSPGRGNCSAATGSCWTTRSSRSSPPPKRSTPSRGRGR